METSLTRSYEEDFRGFSSGVRPGRRPHHALEALSVALTWRRVHSGLECAMRGFFDPRSHAWLDKCLQPRVVDPRVLRLLQNWLRAGVSEEGQWSETPGGVPQGAVLSPLWANGYLYDVFDLGVDAWRQRLAQGDMGVVRCADEFVLGCEPRRDAERRLAAWRDRLQPCGRARHAEKTRLIACGPYALANRQQRGEGQPDTCAFLGFTHMCERHRKTGSCTVRR